MLYQGRQDQLLVKLVTGSTAVTGVAYGSVAMAYWKPGFVAFSSRSIAVAEWREIGLGFYALTLPATLLDTVGEFYFKLTGIGFDAYESWQQVAPMPPALATPSLCSIQGNLVDIGGNPGQNQLVVFRIVNVPKKNGTNSLVLVDKVTTYPDAFGNFSVQLLRGKIVTVEIDRAGLTTYQFTVPDQVSANLTDLIAGLT